jgi:hypothetical protein
MPRHRLLATAAALLLAGAAPALALSTQELIDGYAAEGFTRIEVKTGPTQIKVEAIRGTEKVETIYDAASGAVLKREVEAVGPGHDTAPGVEVRDRGRDFLRGGRAGDDDDDASDDDRDDGGDRGRGRGGERADDDDGDDHGGRGRGRGRGRGGDD